MAQLAVVIGGRGSLWGAALARPWSCRRPRRPVLQGDQVTALLEVEGLRTAFAVADDVTVMGKGEIVHRSPTIEFRRDAALASRLLGVN